MNVSLEIAALFHSAMVGTFILNLLYREHPKNIRCFTKRSITIEQAGVELISNRLSTAWSGFLFSHSAPN